MRVAIVQMGHFSAARGGTPYQAMVFAESLGRETQHEVTYLTRVVAPDATGDGYRIERLSGGGWLASKGFDHQLYRALVRLKPDVIYQQGLGTYTGIAAFFAQRYRTPLLFHACSDYDVLRMASLPPARHGVLQRLRKRFGEYGLARSNSVVVQTDVQRELLLRDYNISAQAVIRNFHQQPSEVESRGEKLRLLWVANFKPVKRPEVFVELAKHFVGDSRLEFFMAGAPGGRRYRKLHQLIDATANLTYLGQLQQDEVNREMAAAHVHVNTSIMEGFPNTFVQAWMRGLPVLTLGVNTDRLFDDERMGHCAPDFDSLCRQVAELAAAPARVTRMGEAGRRHALTHFGMDNARRLADLLLDLPDQQQRTSHATV